MPDITPFATWIDAVVTIVTGLSLIGGSIYSVFKWIIPGLEAIRKSFHQINIIASEFNTNGGSSLRDAINRLETNVSHVRTDALKMEARQWAIIATLRDPIFESDEDGQCVRANPSYLQLVERSIDQVVGNGWENILHVEDRARVWEEWRAAVSRHRTFESSYRIKTQSGVIYNVNCVAVPYFSPDSEDKPLGYIGRFSSVKKIASKSE